MQPYQQRVVAEKTDLDGRIERLAAFMRSDGMRTVTGLEASLLGAQLDAMRTYSGILEQRVAAFEPEKQ